MLVYVPLMPSIYVYAWVHVKHTRICMAGAVRAAGLYTAAACGAVHPAAAPDSALTTRTTIGP